MMITWQFENAFQNLGEYSKASISPGFEGQQSGDQSSLRDFVGGEANRSVSLLLILCWRQLKPLLFSLRRYYK